MEYNVNYEEFVDDKTAKLIEDYKHEAMASTEECWYCLINGKIFEGQGVKTMGKAGWTSKRGLLQAFYNSAFWDTIVRAALKYNKINQETIPDWKKRNIIEDQIKKALLKHLIDTGMVEFKCISTKE